MSNDDAKELFHSMNLERYNLLHGNPGASLFCPGALREEDRGGSVRVEYNKAATGSLGEEKDCEDVVSFSFKKGSQLGHLLFRPGFECSIDDGIEILEKTLEEMRAIRDMKYEEFCIFQSSTL